jgi:hypothetical protein
VPTKPSKSDSVGFDGASSGESPKIHANVWSDVDGPEVRAALRILHHSERIAGKEKYQMRRNRQNTTESTLEIAPQQAEVILALVRGATVTDATKQANVDRTTFYLWRKSDATFQAELNRAKQEQVDALRTQLQALADPAMATVREMLNGRDIPAGVRLKAALAVLQSIGTLTPEHIGETDPDVIRDKTMFDIREFLR